MQWITLWKKLGRQPMHKMTKDHVYALFGKPENTPDGTCALMFTV